MSLPTNPDPTPDVKRYKEVSDLGTQASNDYALSQAAFIPALVRDAELVSLQTTMEVTRPSFPSELDSLMKGQRTKLFYAMFTAPEGYFEQHQRRGLFTHQLIPSLGSDDEREAQVGRIEARFVALETHHKSLPTPREEEKRERHGLERALEQARREKESLTSFFKTYTEFDKFVTTVNAERVRYQKP